MINILNLSIKKQIFDRATMLACFKYFLNRLQSYLTRAKKVKVAEND